MFLSPSAVHRRTVLQELLQIARQKPSATGQLSGLQFSIPTPFLNSAYGYPKHLSHVTMSSDQKHSPNKEFDPAQWVSQAEAAEMRGVSRQAIADLVGKGRFTTLLIGGKTLLRRSEVKDFKPKPPGPSPKVKEFKSRKAR